MTINAALYFDESLQILLNLKSCVHRRVVLIFVSISVLIEDDWSVYQIWHKSDMIIGRCNGSRQDHAVDMINEQTLSMVIRASTLQALKPLCHVWINSAEQPFSWLKRTIVHVKTGTDMTTISSIRLIRNVSMVHWTTLTNLSTKCGAISFLGYSVIANIMAVFPKSRPVSPFNMWAQCCSTTSEHLHIISTNRVHEYQNTSSFIQHACKFKRVL